MEQLIKEPEVWKPVEVVYEVSSWGRVKKNGLLVNIYIHKNTGYLSASINSKTISLHRLVCESFNEKKEGCVVVNHINGIKTDNYYKNLEWVTIKENSQHAIQTGLFNTKGERHYKSIISNEEVILIIDDYKNGILIEVLAEKYNCCYNVVRNILTGESYQNITGGISVLTKRDHDWKLKGEKSNLAKINAEIVKTIREMYKTGITQKAIGLQFNLTQSGVSAIVNKKHWKHID